MMRLTREDFQRAISEARKNDEYYAPIPFRFGIPNAKETLMAGLEEVMRHKAEWLAEYDQIARWLTDNQGKGLLLIGPPGVGKSEICMKVIPLIFRMALHKIFSRYQATGLCNEVTYRTSLRQRFIAIDDFGIEGTFYDYGNPHIVFSEIVDRIEEHGTLLVANTNLTLEEIKVKYGLRTFDRLRANMHIVIIREKSLRGKYEKRIRSDMIHKLHDF